PRPHRRIRGPDLPAGARAAALPRPGGAGEDRVSAEYSAVVFAYHDVGVRCLAVLLAHGVNVPLVVTHRDDPKENVWFESVEKLARGYDIEVATPADPNTPEFLARMQSISPDFIFSFYYRFMLKPALLATAMRGAYNMHGSLLPKF